MSASLHQTERDIQGCSGQTTQEKSAVLRSGCTCPVVAGSGVQELKALPCLIPYQVEITWSLLLEDSVAIISI